MLPKFPMDPSIILGCMPDFLLMSLSGFILAIGMGLNHTCTQHHYDDSQTRSAAPQEKIRFYSDVLVLFSTLGPHFSTRMGIRDSAYSQHGPPHQVLGKHYPVSYSEALLGGGEAGSADELGA